MRFIKNMILALNGCAEEQEIPSDKWDGRFVSDHNAVAADIVIRKK
jgi:hypothetical protein